MANDNDAMRTMRDDVANVSFDGHDEVDVNLTDEDELANLFAAFDEVSASDDLKAKTLERIIGTKRLVNSEEAGSETANANAASEGATSAEAESAHAPAAKAVADGKPVAKTIAGDKPARSGRKAKWRAIRVAALAACLALALGGGVAYATPASYYEVEQSGSTITLGVNCFGIAVSATSGDEAGQQVIESANLQNVPYEEAVARAIERMEERDPAAPIEYGPQGGEREVVHPVEPQPGQQPATQSGQQPEAQPGQQPDQQPEQQPGQQPESQPASQPQPDAPQPQGGAQPASQPSESPEGGSPNPGRPSR